MKKENRCYEYTYIHNNPQSLEAQHVERVKNRINCYQGLLVEELIKKDIPGFSYDDINNFFTDGDDESLPEIYFWVNMDLNDDNLKSLDKAQWPYINNEYGTWVARTDFGSAQDIYFLPNLASVLFGHLDY